MNRVLELQQLKYLSKEEKNESLILNPEITKLITWSTVSSYC
ncbi:class III lanthipeptide [Mammaliicoccus sp. FSL K6-3158]|jgi:hypothetical protein|nr:class III lanthipeptide [Mammaliicoccus sciuri]MEB5760067.1 class III lanthipeptide [Mammaliicoccus sciuri]HDF5210599.1 class III lanthipeptide [Staphylococcus aureus]